MNPLLFINILQSTISLQLFAHIYFNYSLNIHNIIVPDNKFWRGSVYKEMGYLHIFTLLFMSRPVYINLLFTFVKINLTTT